MRIPDGPVIHAADELPEPPGEDPIHTRAYTRIVVPLDGTAFAEAALPPAATLASETGASLHLVHVMSSDRGALLHLEPVVSADPGSAEWQEQLRSYLNELKIRIRRDWSCPVHTEVSVEIDPAEELADYAGRIGADLVVAATHSRGLIARALLGSVAVDLMRESPCPILLVPSEDPDPVPGETPLQGPVRSVVAALDPSGDADDEVLGHALTLVKAWHAEMHVIQVALVPTAPPGAPAGAVPVGISATSVAAGLTDPVEDRLAEIVTSLRRRGVTAVSRALVGSKPANAILDYVRDTGADVVVVGRHHKSLLERVLLGSASDEILRKSRSAAVMICSVSEEA